MDGKGDGGPDGPNEDGVTPEERQAQHREAVEFPLNDFGNGQRVRLYHGGDILFVPRMGWFVWDGHKWAQDTDSMAVRRRAHEIADFIRQEAFALRFTNFEGEIVAAAEAAESALAELVLKAELDEADRIEMDRLRELVKAADKARKRLSEAQARHLRHAKAAGNSGPISNMLVEAEPYLEQRLEVLNADPMLITTEVDTIALLEERDEAAPEDVRSYVVRVQRPDRRDLITKAMPVRYDPDARAPIFERFLEKIQPDAEMRGFLQRWFGYSLTGLTTEQKLVFLHGSGRNGKSTLVDLIAKMMGEYATTVPIESLTGSETRKGSDATPDLVRLPGARMVRASEPEEGIRHREATVKSFTGGEPILIRKMREEFVEIDPIFKLTISGNHKPNVRGTDDGIWRRILLVPFDIQIPREAVDPLMPLKLWAERSGVLNWLIEGALAFLNGGLQEPKGVTDATEEFREDSDPVRTFLVDACEVTGDPEHFELTKDLVEAFQVYQRDQGGAPWGNVTVSKRLREKSGTFRVRDNIFTPRKTNTANGYAGIRLGSEMSRRLLEHRGQRAARSEDRKASGSADEAPMPADFGDFG